MITLPIAGTAEAYTVQPTKIIALGLNYREHIAESQSVKVQGFDQDLPSEPVLFPKTPNCLIAPEQEIVLPKIIERYGFETPRTDYEGELALIISQSCRNITRTDAYDYVYGFTCMNDVSQRNVQNGDRSGWFRGKSFDTFGPIGPRIVPLGMIGDPQRLAIETRLNGVVMQKATTADMIFPIDVTIAFISENFTLEAGDIILTGTPAGVGPLSPGDVVEVEIERIGTLRNRVARQSR